MFYIILIVVIIVVIGIVQVTVNGPQVQGMKDANQSAMDKYYTEKRVVVTSKYSYENEYYRNNISYENGISCQFVVDGQNKKVHIFRNATPTLEIPFGNIIGCEIFCDSETAGGVGRAVVGGMIAGGSGAVVGAVTAKKHIMSYKIIIYCSTLEMPNVEIVLIKEKTETKHSNYKDAVEFANKVNASIKAIISQSQNQSVPKQNTITRKESADNQAKIVILTGTPEKVKLIKHIRETKGMSLADAKDFVDQPNQVLCEPTSTHCAEIIANEFTMHGGMVQIVDAYQNEPKKESVVSVVKTTNEADDMMSTIEKLAELKDKGILTEEEFTAKKKQLLGL